MSMAQRRRRRTFGLLCGKGNFVSERLNEAFEGNEARVSALIDIVKGTEGDSSLTTYVTVANVLAVSFLEEPSDMGIARVDWSVGAGHLFVSFNSGFTFASHQFPCGLVRIN